MAAHKPEQSFYAYLASTDSNEVCPHNTSSDFTTVLPQQLKLTDFDVALTKLFVQDNFIVPKKKEKVTPIVKTNRNLFENSVQGDVVVFYNYKHALVVAEKKYDNFTNFLTYLNAEIAKVNIDMKITADYENSIPISTTIEYNDDKGYDCYLSYGLATILGFKTKFFKKGNWPNTEKIDLDWFEKAKPSTRFSVQFSKYEVTTVAIGPLIDPNLNDIVLSIQAALIENGVVVPMFVDELNSTLTVDTGHPWSYLSMSTFLNNYLRLDSGHAFRGRMTVKIPPQIINPSSLTPEENLTPPLPTGPTSLEKIVVLASCIAPSYYKGQLLPIAAVLDRGTETGKYNYESSPPIYLPVSTPEVKSIRIQVLTQDLEPIYPQRKPTLAELHFKKKNGYQKD